MPSQISRRNLFRLKPRDYLSLWQEFRQPNDAEQKIVWFRPPGASDNEEEFLDQCTRCGLCIEACPENSIHRAGPLTGVAENSPIMDPGHSPCLWCRDFPCIRACPEEALSIPPNSESPPPIGIAVIDEPSCLVSQGTLCDACTMACPPGINAIKMVKRSPVISIDDCVGCGLCVIHCEAIPKAIRIEYHSINQPSEKQ